MAFPSPSITPPALENYQFYYNGLLFFANTPHAVLTLEGLGLPDVRSGDVNWARDYGQAKGLDLFGGRDLIFDFWEKPNGFSLQSSQLELAAATQILPNEEYPLWFQLPNLPTLCVMCRVRKRPTKIDSDYAAANIAKPELVLHATDPRIYSAGKSTEIKRAAPLVVIKCKVKDSTSVVKLPATPGIKVGDIVIKAGVVGSGTVVTKVTSETEIELNKHGIITTEATLEFYEPSATATIDNEGNMEMRPILVITGPSSRPRFTNNSISGSPSLELFPYERPEEEETIVALEEATAKAKEEYEFVKSPANKEALEAAEKAEKEAKEALEKKVEEEAEGTLPIVKTGDQVLIDTGTPHLVLYYPGGIAANKPEDFMEYLAPGSSWWDLPPGVNNVTFTAFNTEGGGAIEFASGYEL